VGDFLIDLHRSQHRRRLEASAAARGARAGADSVFAEQKQDRFGFETSEGDVGCVGDARLGCPDSV
jgi:hypothetical protein